LPSYPVPYTDRVTGDVTVAPWVGVRIQTFAWVSSALARLTGFDQSMCPDGPTAPFTSSRTCFTDGSAAVAVHTSCWTEATSKEDPTERNPVRSTVATLPEMVSDRTLTVFGHSEE
jgi:hypothetical protein